MTVIVAGTVGKRGFMMTDTRIKLERGTFIDNCRKIYYSIDNEMFTSGYHVNGVHVGFNKELEKSVNIDIEKCMKKGIERARKEGYPEEDIKASIVVTLSQGENKNRELVPLVLNVYQNGDNVQKTSIKDGYRVLFPGDSAYEGGSADHYIEDESTFLIEAIDKFIRVSERSKEVSDICLFAFIDLERKAVGYFEENMYDMREYLIKNIFPDNKLDELIRFQEIN